MTTAFNSIYGFHRPRLCAALLLVWLISSCSSVTDSTSNGRYFSAFERYPYAVVPDGTEYSEAARRALIQLNFKVVMGDADEIRPRYVPQAGRTIVVSCGPLRVQPHRIGTRTAIECEATDLFTGELVYRGAGDFANIYNDFGDPFGAVALAFAEMPRAGGRGREMAELPMRPQIGGGGNEGRASPLPEERRPRQPETASSVESTGTAFFVSTEGHLISNHHVIEGCGRIRVFFDNAYHPVRVIAADVDLDVALLTWPGRPGNVATFRQGRFIRAGDPVVAVGYPLRGLLADEATVTTGTVSAMAGIGNDRRFLQISAPVQAGNSGGPLLDESGRVIGVVVAKLDAARVLEITGDLPQNVNFAINGQLLTDFMNSNGITYATSDQSTPFTAADVAEAAKRFTVPIECISG